MRTASAAILKPVAGIILPAARQLTTHTHMAGKDPAASSAAAGPLAMHLASVATGPLSTREKHAPGKEKLHA